MKATKILKTVKNVSWATQKVRNSDWKKVDIANNGTFTTYKWKSLLRMYTSLFTIVSNEDPETPVYKITAVSDSVVTIEDKHWFEVTKSQKTLLKEFLEKLKKVKTTKKGK